jgi:hypothetical protein
MANVRASGRGFGGVDVTQTLVWFAIGGVYVVLAIAEWYFASHIETIDLQPIKKYAAGTQEQFDKFVKGVRGSSPADDD